MSLTVAEVVAAKITGDHDSIVYQVIGDETDHQTNGSNFRSMSSCKVVQALCWGSPEYD